ncbi:MAG: hypothetical protein H7A37_06395 [Chlamydiales bacterium]|nr:hypothetical protein [Chlamydiia bacterium]MCP5507911.1 hypothetical protein [Chlamydiales bacterium]
MSFRGKETLTDEPGSKNAHLPTPRNFHEPYELSIYQLSVKEIRQLPTEILLSYGPDELEWCSAEAITEIARRTFTNSLLLELYYQPDKSPQLTDTIIARRAFIDSLLLGLYYQPDKFPQLTDTIKVRCIRYLSRHYKDNIGNSTICGKKILRSLLHEETCLDSYKHNILMKKRIYPFLSTPLKKELLKTIYGINVEMLINLVRTAPTWREAKNIYLSMNDRMKDDLINPVVEDPTFLKEKTTEWHLLLTLKYHWKNNLNDLSRAIRNRNFLQCKLVASMPIRSCFMNIAAKLMEPTQWKAVLYLLSPINIRELRKLGYLSDETLENALNLMSAEQRKALIERKQLDTFHSLSS